MAVVVNKFGGGVPSGGGVMAAVITIATQAVVEA